MKRLVPLALAVTLIAAFTTYHLVDADGAEKVLICHVPPGNPANAHVISISASALDAHLAHGDCLAPPMAVAGDPCECGSPNPECEGANCATFLPCNEPNSCDSPVCVTTAEGGGLCVEGTTSCADLPPCVATSDCPEGWICAVMTCCGDPVCVPPEAFCPVEGGAAASAARRSSGDGPTIGSTSRGKDPNRRESR